MSCSLFWRDSCRSFCVDVSELANVSSHFYACESSTTATSAVTALALPSLTLARHSLSSAYMFLQTGICITIGRSFETTCHPALRRCKDSVCGVEFQCTQERVLESRHPNTPASKHGVVARTFCVRTGPSRPSFVEASCTFRWLQEIISVGAEVWLLCVRINSIGQFKATSVRECTCTPSGACVRGLENV